MINLVAYGLSATLILIALFFSSKEDFKYHRISKKYVIFVFLVVMVYNSLIGGDIEKTLSFSITLIIFGGISIFSRGQFGIGDTLILGAIGWFIGNLIQLQYYFLILSFSMLILGTYFIVINYKKNGKQKCSIFKIVNHVPIDKVVPGMVLADDYFMEGLNEKDIQKLKDDKVESILVKQTYPFIPVIFVSFLVYVVMFLAYYTNL